jgi:Fe-S-cluster containining protein
MAKTHMQCREHCGACCIAPSINSPIPNMPNGKPAGVRCIQLDTQNRCMIFGMPERPAFCASLQPSAEMCGDAHLENPREHAMIWLTNLEKLTKPDTQPEAQTKL